MSGNQIEELTEREVSRRTGGRTARVVAAVHAATLELLEERGYDQMEIPEIAERAQVYKTSIYRRWPSKIELVLDVALVRLGTVVPMPDTGSLEGDLISLLSRIAATLATPFARGLLRALMASNELSEDFQNARAKLWNTRFEASRVIVERAIQRGELPTNTSPRNLIEFAVSPLFYRTLVTGEGISDEDLQRVVHQTCRAFH
ncbi:MAG: TetR/AcrR family transcriptional regulator [Moraxellaceae bacterium]|nr:TetR/AcrR family transcriptional regulator [Moraxellaceae bacterium]